MEPSTMRSSIRCCSIVTLVLATSLVGLAQGPTFGLGRAPTDHDLHPADGAVGPAGDELPPGRGTAIQGATAYLARGCAKCHGATATEGPGPRLVGRPDETRLVGIESYAFAPLVWSYINQMMPLDQQHQHSALRPFSNSMWTDRPRDCCLAPDEVYSLTAFLLHRAGIIQETDVMDAESLPQVHMPNRDGYVPPPFTDWQPGMRKAASK